MKVLGFLTIILTLGIPWSPYRADEPARAELVISAEVLEVGAPATSEKFPFQTVKYRVADVCKGKYDKHEILVYHMVALDEGLGDLKAGEKVCVGVIKALHLEDPDGEKPPKGSVTAYVDRDIFIRRCQCSSR